MNSYILKGIVKVKCLHKIQKINYVVWAKRCHHWYQHRQRLFKVQVRWSDVPSQWFVSSESSNAHPPCTATEYTAPTLLPPTHTPSILLIVHCCTVYCWQWILLLLLQSILLLPQYTRSPSILLIEHCCTVFSTLIYCCTVNTVLKLLCSTLSHQDSSTLAKNCPCVTI